eukprot:CAMPEP_0202111528 /NCGR_PEP_ID=MMETSP0965-20130614/29403_1 /ASSEMBLY_ACC=CAM_ASM_000507 /TAXON_ID=4773 /ORGANISM="Schizochytrium aggregatum, Strain ATCC28209" /LENGTH=143 /DNA_ID=CAMNT_0048681025 /DNA_START=86 /DNA_END=517 /DNA_ORIENTATION=+
MARGSKSRSGAHMIASSRLRWRMKAYVRSSLRPQGHFYTDDKGSKRRDPAKPIETVNNCLRSVDHSLMPVAVRRRKVWRDCGHDLMGLKHLVNQSAELGVVASVTGRQDLKDSVECRGCLVDLVGRKDLAQEHDLESKLLSGT